MKTKNKILIIISLVAVLLSLLCISVFATQSTYYLYKVYNANNSVGLNFGNIKSITFNNIKYECNNNRAVVIETLNYRDYNSSKYRYTWIYYYDENNTYKSIYIDQQNDVEIYLNYDSNYKVYLSRNNYYSTLSGYGYNLYDYYTSDGIDFNSNQIFYLRCSKTGSPYSDCYIHLNAYFPPMIKTYNFEFYNNPNGSVKYSNISITGETSDNIKFDNVDSIKYNSVTVYENGEWASGYDNTLYYYSDMDPVSTTQINLDLQNTTIRFNSQLIQNLNPDIMSEMKTGLEMFLYPIKSFTELATGSFVISLILVFIVANTIVTVLCLVIRKKE